MSVAALAAPTPPPPPRAAHTPPQPIELARPETPQHRTAFLGVGKLGQLPLCSKGHFLPPSLFLSQGCVSVRAETHPTLCGSIHFLPPPLYPSSHVDCVFPPFATSACHDSLFETRVGRWPRVKHHYGAQMRAPRAPMSN